MENTEALPILFLVFLAGSPPNKHNSVFLLLNLFSTLFVVTGAVAWYDRSIYQNLLCTVFLLAVVVVNPPVDSDTGAIVMCCLISHL